ncbi:RING zinc finger protein [Echinococcus multilocularis]|uniref:RING-type E3 ubiquitin transferase n=1 Tax=Echinococcus multilocularis TaxID=6211 RepID=A0A068Y724_ECHMU|nr:RING zinc finger protein [Echinococcus multilocularis]
MNDFVRQAAETFISDLDNTNSRATQKSLNNPINICQRRIYHRQRRLQEYETNLRRRSTPPPIPFSPSSRRAICYLDYLPVTTVRVRNFNQDGSAEDNLQECSPSGSFSDKSPSNTANNASKIADSSKASDSGLEYSFCIDRKAECRLRHLIPLQPLCVGPNGRKPECDICLSEYESGHKLRHLPCGHGFHRECIDTWLGTAETCPKCRKNVVGCLRRLQTKEAHMRSQSLTKPLPSLRVPSIPSSGTTDSSTTKPHCPVLVNHTRSSILRTQLAEQRRASEAQSTSASIPISAPRVHGTVSVKPSGQASKPPLPPIASTHPSKVKGDMESISLATLSTTSAATTAPNSDATADAPNITVPLPSQLIQRTLFVENRKETGEVCQEARKKAVEAALKRYECARQSFCENFYQEK